MVKIDISDDPGIDKTAKEVDEAEVGEVDSPVQSREGRELTDDEKVRLAVMDEKKEEKGIIDAEKSHTKHLKDMERKAEKEVKDAEDDEKVLVEQKKYAIVTEFPADVDGYALRLPGQARNHYGCIRCGWKGTWKCPFGFRTGKLKDGELNSHVSGICQERVNYLLSFSRGYRKAPTFSVWHKDFLIGKAAHLEHSDFEGMNIFQEDRVKILGSIKEIEGDMPLTTVQKERLDRLKEELKEVDKGIKEKKWDWHKLWRDVVKVEDAQVDRDTPKRQEIEIRRVSIKDIHNVMRAKYKIIEDDDN